ncbi:MAG: molybdopterin-binding protein [Nitrososphaerales archaeon]
MPSNARERSAVEFLVVGDELLNGTTVDTNSSWLSKELVKLGAIVTRKITVSDDLAEISGAFKLALKRKPAWIFSLGGLGPTFDDKTIEGLALALGRKLKRNGSAVRMLKESYKRRPEDLGVAKGKLAKSSLKMAYLPEGAKPLKNPVGTAPGVICTQKATQIVALPGVPKEMKAIFFEQLVPLIKRNLPQFKEMEQWMKVVGVGEPRITPYLSKIMKEYSPEIYIKSHAMGFRKGRSVLKIQLIATGPPELSNVVREKLMSATREMKDTALKLGGEFSRIWLVP